MTSGLLLLLLLLLLAVLKILLPAAQVKSICFAAR